MSAWRERLRRLLEAMGYTVHRWPTNRFDGMRDALVLLRDAGYTPRIVIDCGANRGDWTRLARAVFPRAAFHLVEPQTAWAARLRELEERTPDLVVHQVAVTEPGVTRIRMVGHGTTGAFVARPEEAGEGEAECPATTLDALLGDRVTHADRALLKLDLEGHEVSALIGGQRLLSDIGVVLTEVHFYEIEDDGRPVFAALAAFLEARGFALYDFACLSARPRDRRLRMGDVIFVRQDSPLLADRAWA